MSVSEQTLPIDGEADTSKYHSAKGSAEAAESVEDGARSEMPSTVEM